MRVLQQHEREQARGLGFVGHQRPEDAGEPDRLVAEVGPNERTRRGRVTLVEDQVQDGEHTRQAFGQELGRRHAVGDRGLADLVLGADEALRHRGLGDQEGSGDLARGESAQGLQGERDARLHRQGRVAAGEDQPEPVVGDATHVGLVSSERLERLQGAELRRLLAKGSLTPQPVDRSIARGRRDPRAGVVGDPAFGPHPHRLRERVLHRVLGQVEVAQDADHRRDRPPLLGPEEAVDDGCGRGRYDGWPSSSNTMTGRISTEPRYPIGSFALASIASSRLGHSTR